MLLINLSIYEKIFIFIGLQDTTPITNPTVLYKFSILLELLLLEDKKKLKLEAVDRASENAE